MLTTVVGLDDVIVVSTADAVLVSARAKAEQVKTLVEQLKAHNHRAAVEHRCAQMLAGFDDSASFRG